MPLSFAISSISPSHCSLPPLGVIDTLLELDEKSSNECLKLQTSWLLQIMYVFQSSLFKFEQNRQVQNTCIIFVCDLFLPHLENGTNENNDLYLTCLINKANIARE